MLSASLNTALLSLLQVELRERHEEPAARGARGRALHLRAGRGVASQRHHLHQRNLQRTYVSCSLPNSRLPLTLRSVFYLLVSVGLSCLVLYLRKIILSKICIFLTLFVSMCVTLIMHDRLSKVQLVAGCVAVANRAQLASLV